MKKILNGELNTTNLPPPQASFDEVSRFALTFDGYEYCGSLKNCTKVANRIAQFYIEGKNLAGSLSDLRAALFWEQRRVRNQCCGGLSYDEEEKEREQSLTYMHAIVEKIRCLI
jgi:hypothetical protein